MFSSRTFFSAAKIWAILQVLLTRSELLSDKLRTYTRKLIETLTSKSLQFGQTLDEQNQAPAKQHEGDAVIQSVFSLTDESFPLICTFDRFLKLIENTAK